MGFFWSILPAAMFGATAYFPWFDISVLAPFGFLGGLIPLVMVMTIRGKKEGENALFGRDSQNRLSLFGCSPFEVVDHAALRSPLLRDCYNLPVG